MCKRNKVRTRSAQFSSKILAYRIKGHGENVQIEEPRIARRHFIHNVRLPKTQWAPVRLSSRTLPRWNEMHTEAISEMCAIDVCQSFHQSNNGQTIESGQTGRLSGMHQIEKVSKYENQAIERTAYECT